MTDKQERFCREYLIDHNATQAAIRAGFSKKTANEQGSRLLANVNISKRLQQLTAPVFKKLEVTHERITEELAKIAFLDVSSMYDKDGNLLRIIDMPEDTRRAVAGIRVTRRTMGDEEMVIDTTTDLKISDKQVALDKLGKHLDYYEKDSSSKPTQTIVNIERPGRKNK